MRPQPRIFFSLFALFLALAPLCHAASTLDAEYVEGLRQRRLYRLVDIFCRQRIADSQLSGEARVELTVEWLRSATQQALEAPPEARPQAWDKLDEVAASAEGTRQNARSVLIDIQLALGKRTQGEQLREHATLLGEQNQPVREALPALRTAIAKLREADEHLDQLLRDAYQLRASELADAPWTPTQLEALRRNLHLELARALRNQATCFAADSPDAANALSQALEHLDTLVELSADEPVVWSARLEQLACLRLLGQTSAAREQFTRWQQATPPAEVTARLRAEELRLLMAEDQLAEATERALRMVVDAEALDPESHFAALEVLITVQQHVSDHQQEQILRLLSEQVERFPQQHGPYWARRAKVLLGRGLADNPTSDDPALLLHAAESLYTGGELHKALATYETAAERFREIGQLTKYFDATRTAAAILAELGETGAAIDRLRSLANAQAELEAAPEAHFLAIGLAADRVRAADSAHRQAFQEEYHALLKEHLEQWPRQAHTEEIRWWLARYLMSQRQWTAAIDTLAEVPPESDVFRERCLAMATSYRHLLQEAEPAAQQRFVAEATRQLQPIITGAENRWPEAWSSLQRQIALELARLQLDFAKDGPGYVERLLGAALEAAPAPSDEWQILANTLRAEAQFRAGKIDEAIESLPPPEHLSPHATLRIFEALPLDSMDLSLSAQIAELILQRSTHFSDEDLTEKQAAELAYFRGIAHAALDQRQQALDTFRQAIEANPRDAALHIKYAELLAKENHSEDWPAALAQWQKIETRCQPGSRNWRRARQARIELLKKLGKEEKAAKLKELTGILYPE